MAEKGYRIQGRLYPYVPVEEWLNRDFILAKRVSGSSLSDLFAGRADALGERLALGGIAWWHGWPTVDMDKAIEFLWSLKPADITEEGFDEAVSDSPPDGPAETPDSVSSESSEPPSETATEPSSPETSP